jgi:hypothetical protein
VGIRELSEFVIGEIKKFTLSASSGSNGSISPSGNVIVDYGSTKTFIITPDAGYQVDSLFVDGIHSDSTTSYTFTDITNNYTIGATFKRSYFTITATAGSGGTITPAGGVTVPPGGSRRFTFAPIAGYHFADLLVDGIHSDSTTGYTFINVADDHTIDASFGINTYIITATAGAHGAIEPAGGISVNHGSSKKFTIIPESGYHVDSLFVDGTHVDSTTSYTFYNIEENHTIFAKFALKKFAITATTSEGGSINPAGVVYVEYSASQKFTIAPGVGYNFSDMLVDGAHVDSTTSYTFKNVTTAHTIHAVFATQKFTITATAGAGGAITPSGAVGVNYGDSLTFKMQPLTGYIVDSIFVDGIYVDNDTVYTLENITADHTIHVTFTFEDDVKNKESQIPKEYALHQNYPNPFNPSTMVQFDLPHQSVVTLKVYNLLGTEVVTLVDNRLMEPGVKVVDFNGLNHASGIYFYRIIAEGTDGKTFTGVKRMILLK